MSIYRQERQQDHSIGATNNTPENDWGDFPLEVVTREDESNRILTYKATLPLAIRKQIVLTLKVEIITGTRYIEIVIFIVELLSYLDI